MSLRLCTACVIVSLISVTSAQVEETCATAKDLAALETRIDELLSSRLMGVETALADLLARTATTVTVPETTTARLPVAATTAAAGAAAGPDGTFAPGPYIFVSAPVIWAEARDHCRALGGDLPSIHSAEAETQMRAAVPDATVAYWVGINDEDDDGAVAWSDGSILDYELSWGFNHPQKGECGALTSNDALWWDVPCISTYPFVCQIGA